MDKGKTMFGMYLRQARESFKLTQARLAEIIKVDTHTISNWECGLYYPPAKKISLLAKTYRVSENEIMRNLALAKYEKYRPEYEKKGIFNNPAPWEDYDQIEKKRKKSAAQQTNSIALIDSMFGNVPDTFLEKPESWRGEQFGMDLIPTRMFAFRLLDQSMEPEFQQGSILICDKYRPSGGTNCKVLIKIKNCSPSFRVLTEDGNKIIIRPINPSFDVQVIKKSDIEWKYAVTKSILNVS